MSSLARVLMTGLEVTDLLLAIGRTSGMGDRLLKLAQQREPRLRTAGVVPVNVGGIASARDRALAGPSGVELARTSTLPRSADVPGVDVSPPPPAHDFARETRSAALETPSPMTTADATGEPLPAPERVYRTTEVLPLEAPARAFGEPPVTPPETPSARRRPPTG